MAKIQKTRLWHGENIPFRTIKVKGVNVNVEYASEDKKSRFRFRVYLDGFDGMEETHCFGRLRRQAVAALVKKWPSKFGPKKKKS